MGYPKGKQQQPRRPPKLILFSCQRSRKNNAFLWPLHFLSWMLCLVCIIATRRIKEKLDSTQWISHMCRKYPVDPSSNFLSDVKLDWAKLPLEYQGRQRRSSMSWKEGGVLLLLIKKSNVDHTRAPCGPFFTSRAWIVNVQLFLHTRMKRVMSLCKLKKYVLTRA